MNVDKRRKYIPSEILWVFILNLSLRLSADNYLIFSTGLCPEVMLAENSRIKIINVDRIHTKGKMCNYITILKRKILRFPVLRAVCTVNWCVKNIAFFQKWKCCLYFHAEDNFKLVILISLLNINMWCVINKNSVLCLYVCRMVYHYFIILNKISLYY